MKFRQLQFSLPYFVKFWWNFDIQPWKWPYSSCPSMSLRFIEIECPTCQAFRAGLAPNIVVRCGLSNAYHTYLVCVCMCVLQSVTNIHNMRTHKMYALHDFKHLSSADMLRMFIWIHLASMSAWSGLASRAQQQSVAGGWCSNAQRVPGCAKGPWTPHHWPHSFVRDLYAMARNCVPKWALNRERLIEVIGSLEGNAPQLGTP